MSARERIPKVRWRHFSLHLLFAVDKGEFRKLIRKLLAASVEWSQPAAEDIDGIFDELETEGKAKLAVVDVRSILLAERSPPRGVQATNDSPTAKPKGAGKEKDKGKEEPGYAWDSSSPMVKPRGKKAARVAPITE